MLLKNFDLKDAEVQKSLLLNKDFCSSWQSYRKQYMTALDLLFGLAKKKKCQLNSMSMPFMFIFRHSVELMLKVECNNCLLYTSPSPRDRQKSRMPSSA